MEIVRICNPVLLPASVKKSMLAHALGSADKEVCGLLGKIDHCMTHYYPVDNIARDADRTFLMAPQQQLDAMLMMQKRGEILGGIFHTHPNSPAYPSERDLELAAYPDVINFIVSMNDDSMTINSFRYHGRNLVELR